MAASTAPQEINILLLGETAHLHKNAKDNIVFCFTNTRETFFCPGDTLPVLKKQLDEIKRKSDIEIKIYKDTIYCFDNDSFRFLATVKKRIIFTDNEKKSFISSWKKSTNKSMRLLQHIIKCKPHQIKETILLNNAKQIVTILYKPFAEVTRNIQKNIAKNKRLKEEIQRSDITTEELKQKFGKCKFCSCPVKSHKVIFYENKSIIKNKILEDQVKKQNYIEILQKKIDKLQEQQKTINDIIIQFTQFLSPSTITTFNDLYVKNLDYIINFEKSKFITSKNYNNKIFKCLEKAKINYDEMVKTIKNKPLSFENIFRLEQQLYSLPDISKYLQDIKTKEKNAFKYQEKHKVFRNQNYKLSQILNAIKSALKNKRGLGKFEEKDKKKRMIKNMYERQKKKEDKKEGKEKEKKNDFFKTNNSFNINNTDNSCFKSYKADDSFNNKIDNSTHKATNSSAHKTDNSSKINKTDYSSKIDDSSKTDETVKTDDSSNNNSDNPFSKNSKTNDSFKIDKTDNSFKIVEADDSFTLDKIVDSSTINDSSRANKIDNLFETIDIDNFSKAIKSDNSFKTDKNNSITYETYNPSKIDNSSKVDIIDDSPKTNNSSKTNDSSKADRTDKVDNLPKQIKLKTLPRLMFSTNSRTNYSFKTDSFSETCNSSKIDNSFKTINTSESVSRTDYSYKLMKLQNWIF
ncbi:1637_t:CDS:2 [Gigaspora margarita]|uniref:1637_t:CDS:1 n=1 Tax=Gigaspora margarita TaxID=4874 RepID=A0ABN7URI0_GIGMA|nr:1637_t:CDS:2 [Gigaspora margarita]